MYSGTARIQLEFLGLPVKSFIQQFCTKVDITTVSKGLEHA